MHEYMQSSCSIETHFQVKEDQEFLHHMSTPHYDRNDPNDSARSWGKDIVHQTRHMFLSFPPVGMNYGFYTLPAKASSSS